MIGNGCDGELWPGSLRNFDEERKKVDVDVDVDSVYIIYSIIQYTCYVYI